MVFVESIIIGSFTTSRLIMQKHIFFRLKDSGLFSIRYKSGIWEIIGDAMGKEEIGLVLFKDILNYILLTKKIRNIYICS